MPYLNEVRIIQVLPCIAKPGTIRFISELDRDISEVLPYLNTILDGAIYNHEGHNITLKKDNRLIGIHGRQLSAGKVIDLKDADNLINWFKDLVNDTYDKKDSIKPNYERRKKLTVLDILKLMPLTNCKKCGEATCTAFAVKLAAEEKHVLVCADLFSGKFNAKKDLLLDLLKQCGYKIPSIFANKDELNAS
ncbi:MAG: hypothetical protein A2474_07590 [Elusimicrobia bacterium RIFOXYC2_FULL_34_12]|nr:MAG: hypothetical protein A2474_07590 [Elusimicrobia bacterium RIFOXYC2_FULL_34_12]OGS38630.1 MAG: hypothetical protein A2551_06390 [Elusimicrobia bacterium RIFOXYD2_FULL_34_30]HAM38084.1 Fe-S cluster protein [Elusimicrobiota bacterium]